MVPSIYIPFTPPHCLVSTEGNVNFLGTRNIVYSAICTLMLMILEHLTDNTTGNSAATTSIMMMTTMMMIEIQ